MIFLLIINWLLIEEQLRAGTARSLLLGDEDDEGEGKGGKQKKAAE